MPFRHILKPAMTLEGQSPTTVEKSEDSPTVASSPFRKSRFINFFYNYGFAMIIFSSNLF